MRRALVAAALSVGCSRVPEEPSPIVADPTKGKPVATQTPSPPKVTQECPADPAPHQLGKLYGSGHASFVTPDGAKHTFEVEIARTQDAQARGLMYRTALADDAGMVFVFDEVHHAKFWMKNTCIPLDIVFVGEDLRVLGVVTAKPFDESGASVNGFSKYVVELAAGVAKKRGIAMGTTFVPPP